ncbi:hypothetical protein C9374_004801 [Naegleria lovaniensis]|uniref:Uncharacterized protein n=1 Tax=Naegleria lovaniensis TaxID=51637 RepID=A0AA88KII2_NAELO|nr:uncharacterized protein C9374_004801 [Naegleria lovaniensis]KAG2382834.1 hypothetical protein C9374_004801 [Naegleria lovaniensis]
MSVVAIRTATSAFVDVEVAIDFHVQVPNLAPFKADSLNVKSNLDHKKYSQPSTTTLSTTSETITLEENQSISNEHSQQLEPVISQPASGCTEPQQEIPQHVEPKLTNNRTPLSIELASRASQSQKPVGSKENLLPEEDEIIPFQSYPNLEYIAVLIISLLLSIALLGIAIAFFGLVYSDPEFNHDPNAIVYLHRNCCLIETLHPCSHNESKGCLDKFNVTYPLLGKQVLERDPTKGADVQCSFQNRTRFASSIVFSNSISSPSDGTMDCYTNSEESKVSLFPKSELYDRLQMGAVVFLLLALVAMVVSIMLVGKILQLRNSNKVNYNC